MSNQFSSKSISQLDMLKAFKLLSALLLVIVSLVHTTTSALSSSCTPYPSDLKSLKECCKVPVLFENRLIGACVAMCDKEASKSSQCIIECLLKNNGLLARNEINKTAMAHLYDKFGLADPGWKNVTQDAMENCPFEINESVSLMDSFDDFELCMNEYFQEHCIEGREPVECDAVEDFMEECQNIQADCSTWPRWIVKLPEYCCYHPPELFSKAWKQRADTHCETQDLLSNLAQMQCRATFLLKATGIKVSGKWNFDVALDLLLENSGNNTKWSSAIEKTIETCRKQVHDDEEENQSEVFVEFWFYECIKGTLADRCPEYTKSTKPCRRLAKHKNSCPDSVPPRRTYMVNGRM